MNLSCKGAILKVGKVYVTAGNSVVKIDDCCMSGGLEFYRGRVMAGPRNGSVDWWCENGKAIINTDGYNIVREIVP